MGLDMYLSARKDFHDKDWAKDEEKEVCKKVKKAIPEIFESGNLNTITIGFEIGYWRKANQIHNWFVENVQDGKDDCEEYYVSRKKLQELLRISKEVLFHSKLIKGKVCNGKRIKNDKWEKIMEDGEIIEDNTIAKNLLPTQSGFFFGGTDYDEYYYRQIKSTIKIIEKTLQLGRGWNFYYESSW